MCESLYIKMELDINLGMQNLDYGWTDLANFSLEICVVMQKLWEKWESIKKNVETLFEQYKTKNYFFSY